MNIYDFTETIETKQDFDKFLAMLHKEYITTGNNRENEILNNYLESLSAFSTDIDGYYKNINEKVDVNVPTWKLFEHILLGATNYE